MGSITKNICLQVLLFMLVGKAHAQCLFINPDIKNRDNWPAQFMHLEMERINIPVYIVMPESLKKDSSAISRKMQNLNAILIFNNAIFDQTKSGKNETTISFYDRAGDWRWKKDIRSIDKRFLNDSILSIQPNTQAGFNITKYRQDYQYIFNVGLGSIKITDKKGNAVHTIYPSDFPFDILVDKLDEYEAAMMQKTGLDANLYAQNYSPKYTWFDTDASSCLYALFQYVSITDTIEYTAFDKHCIVKYSKDGQFIDLYPVIDNYENTFFDQRMCIKDSHSVFFITHDLNGGYKKTIKDGKSDTIPFISEFRLKNGNQFEFHSNMPFDLPSIYKRKYFEWYLDFSGSRYPYAVLYLSNTIYNLENGKSGKVINDSLYHASVNWSGTKEGGAEDFFIMTDGTVDHNNHLYLMYTFKNHYTFNIYDQDLNIVSSHSLDQLHLNPDLMYAEIDIYKRTIYLWQRNTPRYFTLPLDLFF